MERIKKNTGQTMTVSSESHAETVVAVRSSKQSRSVPKPPLTERVCGLMLFAAFSCRATHVGYAVTALLFDGTSSKAICSVHAAVLYAIGLFSLTVLQFPASAETFTIDDYDKAVAEQRGVYVVRRDMFRRGGHEWVRKAPNPYGDGYSYGDAELKFSLGDVVPAGSTIEAVVFTWDFSDLDAATYPYMPESDADPGDALAPRVYGSDKLCADNPCSPAKLDRFEPQKAFWASRLTLAGQPHYWFPQAVHRNPSGSLNLLDLWPAELLLSQDLTFVFTTQYEMGRPFFITEGWNSITQFDVRGSSSVNAAGHLTAVFTPPVSQPTLPPVSTPSPDPIPEPSTLLLVGGGVLTALGLYRGRSRS